jgi:hypothetical protein
MPKLVWNGGLEIDWKTLGAIVWAVWMAAGGWYKLNSIEQAQAEIREQLKQATWTATIAKRDGEVIEQRVSSLETRIDKCCFNIRR